MKPVQAVRESLRGNLERSRQARTLAQNDVPGKTKRVDFPGNRIVASLLTVKRSDEGPALAFS
jgi:hypothetical protein